MECIRKIASVVETGRCVSKRSGHEVGLVIHVVDHYFCHSCHQQGSSFGELEW